MNTGRREPLQQELVTLIRIALGANAAEFDLHLVDLTRGAMRVGRNKKCFWLTDGRRVTVQHILANDSLAISITLQPDLTRPKPLQLQ